MNHQTDSLKTNEQTKPIRSLHILGRLGRGGIEVWLMNILRLRDPRLHFDFAVNYPGVFDDEVRGYGSTIHMHPRSRNPWAKRRALRAILKNGQYDVVHCHGMEFAGDELKLANEMGVPVRVAHAHNTGWCRGRKGLVMAIRKQYFAAKGKRQILKYATNVLGCSHDAGRFYLGKDWGQEKTQALHYGIPLESYHVDRSEERRLDLCQKYGIPTDAIVIGHIGSLSPPKNQQFLLEVFRDVLTQNGKCVLFIAGEGEARPELEKTIRQFNLENRVFMPGSCDNVPELICHLFETFVLPSTYEGLGLVLIEAAAGGLHCVCSDVIPKECTDAIGELATRLSLTDSIETWGTTIVSVIKKRKTPKDGVGIVRKTDFDRNKSLESLVNLYRASLAQ